MRSALAASQDASEGIQSDLRMRVKECQTILDQKKEQKKAKKAKKIQTKKVDPGLKR
jgi:hypothetical protein